MLYKLGLLFANLLILLPCMASPVRTVFIPSSEEAPEFGRFIELGSKGKARLLHINDPVSWALCEATYKKTRRSLELKFTRCAEASPDLEDKVALTGEWKKLEQDYRHKYTVEAGIESVFQKSLLVDRYLDGTPANMTEYRDKTEIQSLAILFGTKGGLDQSRKVVRAVIERFMAENPLPQKGPKKEKKPTADIWLEIPPPITEQDI